MFIKAIPMKRTLNQNNATDSTGAICQKKYPMLQRATVEFNQKYVRDWSPLGLLKITIKAKDKLAKKLIKPVKAKNVMSKFL